MVGVRAMHRLIRLSGCAPVVSQPAHNQVLPERPLKESVSAGHVLAVMQPANILLVRL